MPGRQNNEWVPWSSHMSSGSPVWILRVGDTGALSATLFRHFFAHALSSDTGSQDKGKRKRPRRPSVVMNDSSTSSSSDADSEGHMSFGRAGPGACHTRHSSRRRTGVGDPCGLPVQPCAARSCRRVPPPHPMHRRSCPTPDTPSPACGPRPSDVRFRRPPPAVRGARPSRSPLPRARSLYPTPRRARPHTCHSPGLPLRGSRPVSAGAQYRPRRHGPPCPGSCPGDRGRGPRYRLQGRQQPHPRSSSPLATRRRQFSSSARPLHAAVPGHTCAPGYSPETFASCAVAPPPFPTCLPPRHLAYSPLPASPVPVPYQLFPQGPPRPPLTRTGLALSGKPAFPAGLNGQPLDLPVPIGPRRNTFLAVV